MNPGMSGSKPCVYFGFPVAVTVASVRPWKACCMVMISTRSVLQRSLAYLRASLMAASFASAPLLQKKARSAKECSHKSCASRICGSMWYRLLTWIRVSAWARIASTILGWQCPRASTAIPPTKSRYSFPSESQRWIPFPRTRTMGNRAYVLAKYFVEAAINSWVVMLSTLLLCSI